MLAILPLIAVLLTLVALAFLFYMGFFRRIAVQERDQGPFTFVYREMNGTAMKKVGEMTAALNALLSQNGIERRRPLGIYFPDGRAEIGLAVDGVTPERLAALGEKAKVREVPARHCLVANVPWHNPLSFAAGYFKVYPAFAKHRARHGYQKVEAMTLLSGAAIIYMQPIVLEKLSPL